MKKKQRYEIALKLLNSMFPDAKTELKSDNPFQLLVAVILSAQCTDQRVNTVTPALFARYPDPEQMSKASPEQILPYIKSISYPNNKARHLSAMAKRLYEVYSSKVPSDIAELQTLQGVGRKTANVVASVVFHQNKMPVDTHVFRVSSRIGLSTGSHNVLETEKQLVANTPEERIALLHHQLLFLGRYVCKARKPLCENCSLTICCKYFLSKTKKEKPDTIKKS